jgi:hypothetical protein
MNKEATDKNSTVANSNTPLARWQERNHSTKRAYC